MDRAFIFAAGWVFFAAWGVVLAAIGVIAFGRDIFVPAGGKSPRPSTAKGTQAH